MVEVREEGFIPMSVAGVFLLALAICLAAHLAWSNHERRMMSLRMGEMERLSWEVAVTRAKIGEILRWAGGQALLQVSRQAELYHPDVEESAGAVACVYLLEELRRLNSETVHVENTVMPPVLRFERCGEFTVVHAHFPWGLRISARSSDNSIEIRETVWDVDAMLRVRFFLLENIMDNFAKRMKNRVFEIYRDALYLKAWIEAWSTGTVRLDRETDEIAFRLSWCLFEREIFGNSDWFGTIGSEFPPDPSQVPGREIWELKRNFAEMLERVNSARRSLEIADGGPASLELLRRAAKDLIEAENIFHATLRAGESGGVWAKIIGNLRSGHGEVIPSRAGQLTIGLSGVRSGILTAELMVEEGDAENARGMISNLLREIEPRKVKVEVTADGKRLTETVEVYAENGVPPSLPALQRLLEGIISDLERLSPPSLRIPSVPESSLAAVPAPREYVYRAFPPKPGGFPFISVYHALEIGDIRYSREDPAGLLGGNLATPVYLPFIDTVVWWGMWSVKVELDWAVEEAFDYPNQVLLQETPFGHLHSSLSYRWFFGRETFDVRVTVFSLEPFLFSVA
jgi:hypothetical protein